MSQSSKWKLAIVVGISECLVYAEARYCTYGEHGEQKYFMCPRTEYCCNLRCCVSPGFQVYHLWYYWLLVIIMFLVCSGGGWWYRYWLQGRYRAAASAIPHRTSNSRTQNPLRGPTCQAQQARISYNTARNTVLLHRMWKGPHRSSTSPAFNGAGSASSAAHYQNTSVVLNDVYCPYYQLYGPPPSYETVIAQTRGKLSTPSSPELMPHSTSNIHHSRAVVPMPPPLTDPGFHCYYGVPGPPSSQTRLEAPQYQPPRLEGFDTAEYVRIVQQYGPGATMMSPRHQSYLETRGVAYDRSNVGNTNKPPDSSNADVTNCNQIHSPVDGGFSRVDCSGSSCALDRQLQCYASSGKLTSNRVGVHGFPRRDRTKFDSAYSSQAELLSEPIATTSSTRVFEGHFSSSSAHRSPSRRIQGGSLKIPRRRDHHSRHLDVARANRRLSSTTDYESSRQTTSRDTTDSFRSPQARPGVTQSSPSNNVIVATSTNSKSVIIDNGTPNVEDQRLSSHRNIQAQHQQSPQQEQQPQQQPQSLSQAMESSKTEQSSTNTESKRKLDRSKSLD